MMDEMRGGASTLHRVLLIVTHNRITRQHRGTPSATWVPIWLENGSHILAKML
jgi:hypothetical protein